MKERKPEKWFPFFAKKFRNSCLNYIDKKSKAVADVQGVFMLSKDELFEGKEAREYNYNIHKHLPETAGVFL